MTAKQKEVIEKLLNATNQGSVPWEPTAIGRMYQAGIRAGNVWLAQHPTNKRNESGGTSFEVTFTDQTGRETARIETSTHEDAEFVRPLFKAARNWRAALESDEAYEEILEDLNQLLDR